MRRCTKRSARVATAPWSHRRRAAEHRRFRVGNGARSMREMRPQPLIAVRDVEASSAWYQRLLGCESGHGGAEYERLVARGELIMQLHNWEVEHDHGAI